MKLLLILLALIPITVVQAGSTALSESKFVVQGDPGTVISQTLTVSNLSDQAQTYRFYPNEPGEAAGQYLSATPSEFRLLPQQSLVVVVRFRQRAEPGNTSLNLVAYSDKQAQASFRVGDGIKIPVRFVPPQIAGATAKNNSANNKLWFWNILIFGIDFMLLVIVCYWCYQRHFWQRARLRHKH